MDLLADVVIGIDPGTHRCGYGLVVRRGNRFVHIAHGVATARPGDPLPARLATIADELERAMDTYAPASMGIEQAFFHLDAQAALMIGHARGVAMLLAGRRNLPVGEYAPATVKRAVVGNGRAEKEQVCRMIQAILGLTEAPALDASDALAIAICHASANALKARICPATADRARKPATRVVRR